MLLFGSTIWMTTLTADASKQLIVAMLFVRGLGMGFSMMPSLSAAYVTLAPQRIPRATSIANVVQRVASGLGIAIMATVLTARISANLPRLPGGATAPNGSSLASAHLPAGIKSILLEQATKGFTDAFWVAAGLTALAFPLTILLRRALRPQEVRSYAMRQLGEGIILGAAARRLREREAEGAPTPRVPPATALPVLSAAALARLRLGQTLLRAGTAAGGLVPQPGASLAKRVSFAVAAVLAVSVMAAATAYAYRTPSVPSLPPVTAQMSAAGAR
jgi:hypothetical protein